MTEQDIAVDTEGLPHGSIRLPSGTRLVAGEDLGYQLCYATTHRPAMVVLASYDTEAHGRLLHISASWAMRRPTWPELMDIQGGLAPTSDMMLVLPRPEKYVNMHEHVMNMYEIPAGWPARIALGDAPPVDTGKLDDGTTVSSDGHIVTLQRRDAKVPWPLLTTFRDAYFDLARDVLVWWDHPRRVGRQNNGNVFMAFTPEPWGAGYFVGVPGISHRQTSKITQMLAERRGDAPIMRTRPPRSRRRRT